MQAGHVEEPDILVPDAAVDLAQRCVAAAHGLARAVNDGDLQAVVRQRRAQRLPPAFDNHALTGLHLYAVTQFPASQGQLVAEVQRLRDARWQIARLEIRSVEEMCHAVLRRQ